MEKIERLKYLTKTVSNAGRSYEQDNVSIISNKRYDKLYDELKELENELGVILPNSPTQSVGYEVLSKLTKVKHEEPMLSLDKSKDKGVIINKFLGLGVNVSWKLDGLTVVLTYENGVLKQAVTRGNGLIGEDVTHTIKHVVPNKIPAMGKIVLRGEAVISYANFEKINNILDEESKYRNPRNLASGTVRSLDSKVAFERYLDVIIFECLTGLFDSKASRLEKLYDYGFNVVDFTRTTGDNIGNVIDDFTARVKNFEYPVDGVVVTVDSISKSKSMGTTGKFPKCSMAFKWEDAEAETILRKIEWSPSKTGLLNPVAIFDPVELEGTTVTRASLHNITYIKNLDLGIGDAITVYKANMIIPQISDNLTRSGFDEHNSLPDFCPVCGHTLSVQKSNKTEVLMCTNPDCNAKLLYRLKHFVSRDAMNIVGLSEGILTQLIDSGLVNSVVDLYELQNYQDRLLELDKMGKKKVSNLLNAIEYSKKVSLANFINALSIPTIGLSQSKLLAKEYKQLSRLIQHSHIGNFKNIEGFGDITSDYVVDWFNNSDNIDMIYDLLDYVEVEDYVDTSQTGISDNNKVRSKIFVVTGDVNHYKNRKELQAHIESLGGKVTSSVSSKTDYLINNDISSTSNKNKKAKELGIPIITEDDFIAMT